MRAGERDRRERGEAAEESHTPERAWVEIAHGKAGSQVHGESDRHGEHLRRGRIQPEQEQEACQRPQPRPQRHNQASAEGVSVHVKRL